jgi:hypothetical protein
MFSLMFMKFELNKRSRSLTFPKCLMLNMGLWGATTTLGGRDYIILQCHNPSFVLATKTRACNVMGQEGSSGVKESVRE